MSEPDELKQYKRALDIAISEITPDKLRKFVSDARSLSQDESGILNELGLISRMERDDVSSAHVVAPITQSVKSGLAHQLRIVSMNQQIDLYHLFSKSPQTRRMRGILLEAIGVGFDCP